MYMVVGATGYVGAWVLKNILDITDEQICAVTRQTQLNVSNASSGRISWQTVDVTHISNIVSLYNVTKNETNLKVIYLVGTSSPDTVLKNPQTAWNTDIIALKNFLEVMINIKKFYYISSEAVFSGRKDFYQFKDNDVYSPMNLYGYHKKVAEELVKSKGFNVVRFPVMIGRSLSSREHFFDRILLSLTNKKKTEMLQDQIRSIIDFDTATRAMIKIIENPNAQEYFAINISGDEAISKYELGLRIADKYGFSKDLIVPVSMQKGTVFTEYRENIHLLSNNLCKKLLGIDKLEVSI